MRLHVEAHEEGRQRAIRGWVFLPRTYFPSIGLFETHVFAWVENADPVAYGDMLWDAIHQFPSDNGVT